MFEVVFDPERLAALRATGLLGSGTQEGFSRLARLAAERLGVESANITLVGEAHQEVLGTSAADSVRESVPLALSMCRYVVEVEAALAIDDARAHPLVSQEPSLDEFGIGAYAGVPLRSPSGHVLGAVCAIAPEAFEWSRETLSILDDVSALATTEMRLRAAEAELAAHRAQLATMVDSALDAVVVMDETGAIVEYNPAAERLFGYRRVDAMGADLATLLIPREHRGLHEDLMRELAAGGDGPGAARRLEVETLRADGTTIPVELSLARAERGGAVRFTGFMRDLRAAAAPRVAVHGDADELTGLPNRRRLEEAVSVAIAAEGERAVMALLTLDLDDFKTVNDSLGHDCGDVVLREVSRRLGTVSQGAHRLLARQHGDGFVMLAAHLEGNPDLAAKSLAGEVLAAFDAPFELGGLEFSLAATAGVALHPRDGGSFGELLRRAETAMYRAKQVRRGSVGFTQPGAIDDARERLTMTARLRRALARDELVLYYQPIFRLPDPQPVAMEALIRWNDPDRGLIMPGEFIEAAEASGMIVEIGAWVTDAVCRQVSAWGREGLTPRVSYNISPAQLHSGDVVEELRTACRRHGADPGLTLVEITESVAMGDPERTSEVMRGLSAAGSRVAIDDFGAGHSSLTRLRDLPVSLLKIDRALMRGIETDPEAATVVSATLALAEALGISTVAEGVETDGQLALLTAKGCDYAQGFGLARPMPAEQATQLLRDAAAVRAQVRNHRRRWRRRVPMRSAAPS